MTIQYGTQIQITWNTSKEEYTEEDEASMKNLPEIVDLTDAQVDMINENINSFDYDENGKDEYGCSVEENYYTAIEKLLEDATGWLVEEWTFV